MHHESVSCNVAEYNLNISNTEEHFPFIYYTLYDYLNGHVTFKHTIGTWHDTYTHETCNVLILTH